MHIINNFCLLELVSRHTFSLQVLSFHATTKTRRVNNELPGTRLTHPAIRPGGSDQWNGERLVIPPGLPPSFLNGCRIIDINYVVRVGRQKKTKTKTTYYTVQLYCQVSIQLHKECFAVSSTLITVHYNHKSSLKLQQIVKLQQQ